MKITSLVQFKLNPNIKGNKLIVVGLEERPFTNFKKRIKEVKESYTANHGKIDPDLLASFKNDYGIPPTAVAVYGESTMSEDMARKLIPVLKNGNYRCFAIPSSNKVTNKVSLEMLNGHDTALCAWNCLMNLIGKPKYVIIYTAPRDIFDDIHG